MLYLSLVLIISGIFFIFYAILAGVKKNHGKGRKALRPDIPVPPGSDDIAGGSTLNRPEDKKAVEKDSFVPDTIKKKDTDNGSADLQSADLRQGGFQSLRNDEFLQDTGNTVNNDNAYEIIKDESPVTAVLYEDASGMVDYDHNNSNIDSSLNGYKSIKRIAVGVLELSRGGVNFRSGKKLFRFDFNRMNTIKSGNNFMALSLKGSNVFRLFVFKGNTAFSDRVKHVYNSYLTHVL